MEIKKIVEDIILGLSDETPITQILLKSQIVASKLGNENLKTFIKYEQNGYPECTKIPEYRILNAMMRAQIFVPFAGESIVEIPAENLTVEEEFKSLLQKKAFHESLSHLESLCLSAQNQQLEYLVPAITYTSLTKAFGKGAVVKAWLYFDVNYVRTIIGSFKSQLLDIFLRFDEELNWDIDFNAPDNKKIADMIVSSYNMKQM